MRFEVRLHAFCFMTNHVHFLLEVGKWTLSSFCQNVFARYARRVNRRDGRTGHLFERRFAAKLIVTDLQLLNTVRYIHRNPLEAGLVQSLDDYAWSSHFAYSGERCRLPVATTAVLGLLAVGRRDPTCEYCSWIEGEPTEAQADPRLLSVVGGWRGDKAISKSQHAPTYLRLHWVLRSCERVVGVSLEDMRRRSRSRRASLARHLAACMVQESRSLTLRELADRFDRDPSTLSKGAELLRRRARKSPDLAGLLERSRKELFRLRESSGGGALPTPESHARHF